MYLPNFIFITSLALYTGGLFGGLDLSARFTQEIARAHAMSSNAVVTAKDRLYKAVSPPSPPMHPRSHLDVAYLDLSILLVGHRHSLAFQAMQAKKKRYSLPAKKKRYSPPAKKRCVANAHIPSLH